MAQLGCEVMHKSMRKVINVLKGVRRWKEPEPTVKTFSETWMMSNCFLENRGFCWHDQLSQRCCGM